MFEWDSRPVARKYLWNYPRVRLSGGGDLKV